MSKTYPYVVQTIGRHEYVPTKKNTVITAKQARDILGFKSFVVETFTLGDNMSALEEKMQRVLFDDHHYNRVGMGLLIRNPGEGRFFSGYTGACSVYVTYSFRLRPFLEARHVEYVV